MNESGRIISRRGFIGLGGGILGAAALAACGGAKAPAGSSAVPAGHSASQAYCGFRMGVQSWCFREWDLDRMIAGMKELDLGHIELAPSVHLPLDSDAGVVRETMAKLDDAGITIDAFGVERVANDEAQARKAFEFGRTLGVIAISVYPVYDALPLVDRLAGEYGIPVGIHNHGPEDELYATPEMFRERIKDLSPMVGLCVDSGHYGRSGVNPVAVVEEFGERVRMVHLKDMVPDDSNEYGWSDRVVGQGMLDLPGMMNRLVEIGFDGPFSLEYESEPSAPVQPLKQCLAAIAEVC
ncbi:MAG: sugar phosphate isomerase/epimerase [Candidatus Glassbacteria bacterium]|nr:sugar phosphate isomerase/epimerase [Candidatus Glassbacteria bacterium]